MLTEKARGLLRAAAKGHLEEVIAKLHQDHPQAFHTEETLKGRRFFDRPLRGEPCAYVVRSGTTLVSSGSKAAAAAAGDN